MNKITKIGGILIVFVALVALLGSAWTFAQEQEDAATPEALPETTSPDTPNDAQSFGPRGPRGGHDDGLRGLDIIDHDAVEAAIADALGLSVEELDTMKADGMSPSDIADAQGVDLATVETAVQAVVADAVAQAVADGTITQEQADMILERGLRLPGFGGPRGGHDDGLRGLGIFDKDAMEAAAADALGITVEALQAYHDDGLHIPEVAEELGVDLETVQAAIQAAREEAIAQAVADGSITQEQADMLLQGDGPGFDGGRGHHGGHRGFQGAPHSHGNTFNNGTNTTLDEQDA